MFSSRCVSIFSHAEKLLSFFSIEDNVEEISSHGDFTLINLERSWSFEIENVKLKKLKFVLWRTWKIVDSSLPAEKQTYAKDTVVAFTSWEVNTTTADVRSMKFHQNYWSRK